MDGTTPTHPQGDLSITYYIGKALDQVSFAKFSEPYSGCEDFPSVHGGHLAKPDALPLSVCMRIGSHPDAPPTRTSRTRHCISPPTEVPIQSLFIASLVRFFTISPERTRFLPVFGPPDAVVQKRTTPRRQQHSAGPRDSLVFTHHYLGTSQRLKGLRNAGNTDSKSSSRRLWKPASPSVLLPPCA